jgi:alkylation response protein AidB-like acyl-CoA dehydrogenase
MLFELTEEEKLIQAAAARFAKQELEPAAAELDRTKNRDRYPARTLEETGRARFYGDKYSL